MRRLQTTHFQIPSQLTAGSFHLETALYEEVSMTNENLNDATLERLSIARSRLTACQITGATLKGADLSDTEILKCQIFGSNFDSSHLLRLHFEGGNASGVVLSATSIKDVTFKNMKLSLANFSRAKLSRVAFQSCELSEVSFQSATLSEVSFSDCILAGASFDASHLYKTTFGNADLSHLRGLSGLRGVSLSPSQIIQLAPLLAAEAGINQI
jgi:uncharacterized protein YjbI with pentapeptide repeats